MRERIVTDQESGSKHVNGDVSLDSEYAEAYADLHRRHWWWRSREEYLFSILNRISIPQQANVLEIGCGGGWLFDRLSDSLAEAV